jgi:hypothetical protein
VRCGAGLHRTGEIQGSNPSSVLVQFTSTFGSNPLLNRVGDNLVSDGQCFTSSMNSGVGVETREEKREFLLAKIPSCDSWFSVPTQRNGPHGGPHSVNIFWAGCNTPCYSSLNLSLITIISGLVMHNTTELINLESCQMHFWFNLNLNRWIQTNRF